MSANAREAPSTADQDRIVLHYMLWGFDETPYRVLANKMVVTRKLSECAICFEAIPVGSRVRAQTEVYDGDCKTFRLCATCCAAVIADHEDGDCLRMEERTQIGIAKAMQKHESEAPHVQDS